MGKKLVKLQSAIFWRVGLMAIVSILVVGMVTHFYIQWTTLNTLKHTNQIAADEIAKSLDAQLRTPVGALRQTAILLQRPDVSDEQSQAFLQSAIQDSDALEAILLLDESGMVRNVAMRADLASHVPDVVQTDLSHHPAFTGSRSSSRAAWSPVAHSPWTGERTVSICQHVGKGWLLGVVSIDPLQNMIRTSAANHQHSIAVIDAGGNVSFQSQPDSESLPLELLRARLVHNGLAGHAGSNVLRIDSRDFIMSVAPMSSCGWIVLTSTPTTAARIPVITIDLIFVALGLMACALVASASINLGRRLDDSLNTMSSVVSHIAYGNTDISLPAQPYAELEQLGHGVREMAAAIRQREQKHQATQQMLQLASKGVSSVSGQGFFSELVSLLSATTRARCVLATEWISGAKPRARILAARANVPLENDFTYEISGNPCALLREKSLFHCLNGVSAEYFESPVMRLLGAEGYIGAAICLSDGTVAGHFAIIDDHELSLDEDMRQLLLVLAARAGTELERLQIERRLKESDGFHRALIQSLPEMVCRSTIDGTLTFVNDAYCQYFGRKRDDLVGRAFLSSVSDEERERLYAHFAKLTAGNVGTIEVRVQLVSGEMRWQQWLNRPLVDAKGRIVEYQGSGIDVTDRHQNEELQAEQERRLRQLAESVGSVLWLIDWTTQKVLYCSPAYQSIWGTPESTLAENPMAWTIAIVEEDRARVVRRYLAGATEGSYNEQYRIVRPDGSVRWIRDRRFPIRSSEGQVYRVAGVSEDITDQMRSER